MPKNARRLPFWQRHQTNERGRIVLLLLAALTMALAGVADANVRRIESRAAERELVRLFTSRKAPTTLPVRTLARQTGRLHLVRGGA